MSESDVYCRLASVRKCPVCGGALDTVYFSLYRGFLGVRPSLPKNLPALKCGNCCIAILDYEKTGFVLGRFMKRCVNCGKEIPIASEVCPSCEVKQPEYERSAEKR